MKTKLTEENLILAIQSRNRTGAEALYDMYSSNLFKVIYGIVQHQEMAEDTLQQVFLKVWTSIDQYHTGKGRLYTWMITIARNCSKDALRSKSYHNEIRNSDINMVGHEVDMQYQTSMNINFIGIREYVAMLKYEYRQIINLIYFQGYTHVEVADELGIPLGTVKTRWNTSISKLRKLLS